MTRDEAIETIGALYPADSVYEDCATIGSELLKRAERETGYVDRWENRPDKTLIRYAEYCIIRDRDNERMVKEHLNNFRV